VCGSLICTEPSCPPGDAPCPACGCLLRMSQAIEDMVLTDPKFRIEEYRAVIQWVGGRRGTWEIYFTHRISGQRKCLRWIQGLLYGGFIDIKCPPQAVRPHG
jgi:hypothetical protein